MTEQNVRDFIAKEVIRVGSLRKLASVKSVSHSYLHDVVQGKRGVSAELAEKFGFERVVSFKKIS